MFPVVAYGWYGVHGAVTLPPALLLIVIVAIEADCQRMAQALHKASQAALLASAVAAVYRRQGEKLRAARDMIRFYLFYLETAEEAVTVALQSVI